MQLITVAPPKDYCGDPVYHRHRGQETTCWWVEVGSQRYQVKNVPCSSHLLWKERWKYRNRSWMSGIPAPRPKNVSSWNKSLLFVGMIPNFATHSEDSLLYIFPPSFFWRVYGFCFGKPTVHVLIQWAAPCPGNVHSGSGGDSVWDGRIWSDDWRGVHLQGRYVEWLGVVWDTWLFSLFSDHFLWTHACIKTTPSF